MLDEVYHVKFDNGDEDSSVPIDRIRSPRKSRKSVLLNTFVSLSTNLPAVPSSSSTSTSDVVRNEIVDTKVEQIARPIHSIGSLVEVQNVHSQQWYRGRVVNIDSNFLYHIKFDDGEEDRSVPDGLVRSPRRAKKSVFLTASLAGELSTSLQASQVGGSQVDPLESIGDNAMQIGKAYPIGALVDAQQAGTGLC
jgi:hypothetical protein